MDLHTPFTDKDPLKAMEEGGLNDELLSYDIMKSLMLTQRDKFDEKLFFPHDSLYNLLKVKLTFYF